MWCFQITFFKTVYRRYTNFAVESIEQTFNGTAGWNKRVSCTIARNGDLCADCYLEVAVNIDASASCPGGLQNANVYYPGEQIISDVTLSIGGQQIDKHYMTYFRIFDELYRRADHKLAYGRLMGEDCFGADIYLPDTAPFRFYIPLIFFFNRSPGLALPLIALQ